MPELIIDHREISVPQGTKVIDAAERLGIMIPRFCYHPALGSLGACRMCAVLFNEGPVKGLEMSCMVEAEDGMVVSTDAPEAVAFRRWIVECLMLNHPHDCPVCDEGGHCLLQDETVSGGHGIRRYKGKKRTYRDQDLGPFIQHEMNRCIHCWRCRRFYQEYAGYHDLGALGIANRIYFGRIEEGPLSSPFSGNLVDICPTGVFTDKPSRFKGRRWDFERAPSLCLHCSLGCNIVASGRYRELVRVEARLNRQVNGYFMCDRGRYGYQYANRVDRPRRPRVDGREASWDAALRTTAERLGEIVERSGSQAIACLGSVRNSLETQARLVALCRNQGWPEPRFFLDPATERKARSAASRLDSTLAVSMKDLEEADFILAVGVDPINEAPMLALSMRQAQRRGATLAVLDPRPVVLPADFHHVPVHPRSLYLALSALITRALHRDAIERMGTRPLQFYDHARGIAPEKQDLTEQITLLARGLRESRRPVIVCGTNIVPETVPPLAADLALLLQQEKPDTGLFYVLEGANAFGAAILSPPQDPREHLLECIEKGDTRALLLVENDPFARFPDQERLRNALGKLDLLATLDYLPSPVIRMANIVLPTRTTFETRGRYANQEGRVQETWPAYQGGISLAQVRHGAHPPRTFQDHIPGGDVRNASRVVTDIDSKLSGTEGKTGSGDFWEFLEERGIGVAVTDPDDHGTDGVRLVQKQDRTPVFSAENFSLTACAAPPEALTVLLVDWTFGTEELSRYSSIAEQAENPPTITLHARDAADMGIAAGDTIALPVDGVRLEMEVEVTEHMARGIMILPLHRQLDWDRISRIPSAILKKSIKRKKR